MTVNISLKRYPSDFVSEVVVTCSSRLLKGHLQAEQTILSDTSITRLGSHCLSSSCDLLSNSMWKKPSQGYFSNGVWTIWSSLLKHPYLGLQPAWSLFAGGGSLPSGQWGLHHLGISRKRSGTRQKSSSLLVFLYLLAGEGVRNRESYCIFCC